MKQNAQNREDIDSFDFFDLNQEYSTDLKDQNLE